MQKNEIRKFLLAPFVGIFVILLHVITGFPVNNFDPNLGDTLKPIYYSHFLIIAAAFLSSEIFQKSKKNIFLLVPFIF